MQCHPQGRGRNTSFLTNLPYSAPCVLKLDSVQFSHTLFEKKKTSSFF